MVSSSSRRAPRGDRRKRKRQSRSRPQSSAPVSRSEENNDGKLVNKDEEKMSCSPRLADALAAHPDTEEDTPDDSDQRIYESGTEDDMSWLPPDEATDQINSAVFDNVYEFYRYQRLFREGEATEAAARKAKSDSSIAISAEGEHGEMDHHYIGVRSRRAVDKMLNPGQFFLYYNKPSGVEIPVTVDLNIGYMSSTRKIYHYQIRRFECEGDPYYAVRQTNTDVKMFPSIDSLVKHYHTFAHVDPEPDQLDAFGLPPN